MYNVLNVTAYQSPGKRFNGLTLARLLPEHGFKSSHIVWFKDADQIGVSGFDAPWAAETNAMFARVEANASIQSALFTNAWSLMQTEEFRRADLVHLHLIQNGYFSLADLPELTREKPTVWTLHDPWAFTGHCVHPFECRRWTSGCGNCPDLTITFPMQRDNTAFMFEYKRHYLQKSDFDVIVASKWMAEMAAQSLLFRGVPVHLAPFGLDLSFFSPAADPSNRRKFGIPEDSTVLMFRAEFGYFKGFQYLVAALERLESKRPICLLTLSSAGLLNHLQDRFQVVDLGWVNDETIVRNAFRACDVFIMPSLGEAFGVMAIEAMACGKPVVVFDNTSLPEVTAAPDIGIAVPSRDVDSLSAAIQRLVHSPDERSRLGVKARAFAEARYDEKKHALEIATIYRRVLNRRSRT